MIKPKEKSTGGREILDFHDAQLAKGVPTSEVHKEVCDRFCLDERKVKALWVASPEFNARFAYDRWSERKEMGVSGQPARAYLMRKYELTGREADWLHSEYEKGNTKALLKLRDVDALANKLLTERAKDDLRAMGVIK